MDLKRFAYFFVALSFLLSTCSQTTLHANSPPAIPEGAVRISEIYANPPDSSEATSEFVELHNNLDIPMSLAGFKLTRDDELASSANNGQMNLDNITLLAGEYRAFKPSFSLPNGGSTLILSYPLSQDYVDVQTYETTSDTEGKSWQPISAEQWGYVTPTANTAPLIETPEVPDDSVIPGEEPTTPPETKPCDIEGVHISEIVSNPAGSDAAGGEFVELYNHGGTEVSLIGCNLSSDKPATYSFTTQDTIPAKSYRSFGFSNGLLNGSGVITFASAGYEEVIEYPSLSDNEAYALIGELWQKSKLSTPDEANALPSPDEVDEGLGGLLPCPPGKFRNPVSNRCKNIVASSSSLVACKTGQYRNPQTNRCRNITTANATLMRCKPGYERNLATNRCRKVSIAGNTLKPCAPGSERNTETNRCRKVSTLGASLDSISKPPTSMQGQNLALVIMAAVFLLFFLLYEYRLTLRDKLATIRLPRLPGKN